MGRTYQLRKEYRRAAWLGLGLSVIVHAAVLALMRFDPIMLPAAQHAEADAAVLDDAETPVTPEVMRVVAIKPTPTEVARNAGGGGVASSSAGPAPIVATAPTPAPGEFSLPASTEPEPSIHRLAVVDPIRPDARVRSIARVSLPAAETTPVEPADEEESAYVPGSIGKAKRDWADDGAGETDLGRGIGWGISTGAGGDHCPAPGGAPGRGPLWLVAH